jgi:hypothetical protein
MSVIPTPLPPVPPELARDAMRQADDFGTLVFLLVFALLAIVGYR